MKAKIEQYFENNYDKFLSHIQQLIAVQSVKGQPTEQFPFGEGPAKALQLTLKMADELGLLTTNHENYVGTINLNELPSELGILVHVDVVGEGTNWTKQPFGGEIEDGKMYGRGASDDKGPTIASLFALAAVKELGISLKSNARLIVGTDEESGCADTKYYFQKEQPPTYVFSPDGEFPVINTEKGGLRTSFSGSFIEDTQLPRIVSVEGGYRVNVVPPNAQAVVEGLTIELITPIADQVALETGASITLQSLEGNFIQINVEGKGAHASLPHKGINAVTTMLTLLVQLPFADCAALRALKGVNDVFPHGDYYAEAVGLKMEDEQSGQLTMNFAIFKFSPTTLYGFIDSRVPICATEENTMHVLAKALQKFDVELKLSGFSKAHHTPEDTDFVKTLLVNYEQYTGNEGYCQHVGGGTYVHGIPGGVAFGCTMPGVETNIHGADEYIIIEDIITSAKIFTSVIIDICGEK